MPELPSRPGPKNETLLLHRRPKSGFINYPPFFRKRMVDGRARFMTKCDMLIGPCACGYTHYECEDWVLGMLDEYNCNIEILILWGTKLANRGMVVEIPGYWKQVRNWNRFSCDVLVGNCVCGRIHTSTEGWVRRLLRQHQAVILNMPTIVTEPLPTTTLEANDAAIPNTNCSEASEFLTEEEDDSLFCDCDMCNAARRDNSMEAPLPIPIGRDTVCDVQPRANESRTNVEVDRWVNDIVDGRFNLPSQVIVNIDSRLAASLAHETEVAIAGGYTGISPSAHAFLDRRRAELIKIAARAWCEESITMGSAPDTPTRHEWAFLNANADGELPGGWCNCGTCRAFRRRGGQD